MQDNKPNEILSVEYLSEGEPPVKKKVLQLDVSLENEQRPAPPKLAKGKKKKCVTGSDEWYDRWFRGMDASFERCAADTERRLAMKNKD